MQKGCIEMDIQQIRYVLAIAENESMTAAAEKMFVSQSALSLSYKKLEKELGVSLFYKEGRTLSLTRAGEVFCSRAHDVVTAMDKLCESMQEAAEEQNQRIMVCTEAVDFTNEAIKLFIQRYPGVFLQQVRGSTEEIRALLMSRAADFAVTISPDFGQERKSEFLLEEPMMLQVSSSGNYADRTELSLEEVQDEQIVTLREGFAMQKLFFSFFEDAGLSHGRSIEVNDPETINMQVSNGFGISFIPESTANIISTSFPHMKVETTAIPITKPYCRRSLYLTTVQGRNIRQETRIFIDFLRYIGQYVQNHKSFPTYEIMMSEFREH